MEASKISLGRGLGVSWRGLGVSWRGPGAILAPRLAQGPTRPQTDLQQLIVRPPPDLQKHKFFLTFLGVWGGLNYQLLEVFLRSGWALGESWGQDGPRTPPRPPQTPPKIDFRGFWAPIWRILGPILVEFEAHLKPRLPQDPSKTPPDLF